MSFFTFLRRPKPTEGYVSELYGQVQDAMRDVQAYARSHGGQIHLVDVSDEGEVKIKLTGACNGCPMSDLTLKHGIEMQLKQMVPKVHKVIQVL